MKKGNNTMYVLGGAAAIAALLLSRKSATTTTDPEGVGSVTESAYGRVLDVRNKKYSTNGNPSFEISILTEDGWMLRGRTAPNGQIGYKMPSSFTGWSGTFYYHRTPSGKIIFTDFR